MKQFLELITVITKNFYITRRAHPPLSRITKNMSIVRRAKLPLSRNITHYMQRKFSITVLTKNPGDLK